jgi:hypothetical protein
VPAPITTTSYFMCSGPDSDLKCDGIDDRLPNVW